MNIKRVDIFYPLFFYLTINNILSINGIYLLVKRYIFKYKVCKKSTLN